MYQTEFSRHCIRALVVAAFATTAVTSFAAPVISRLTPPSNPLNASATTLARFLPSQKFDLQVTVRPDAGATISTVVFAVDGTTVASISSAGGNTANTNILPATALTFVHGAVPIIAPNSVAASLRGYSNSTVGVHVLTATATDNLGAITTQTGNFEVVGLTLNNGRPAKNIIIMLGDGMSVAHRTAARIVAKGYAQGKAQGRLAMDTFPQTAMVMTASLNSIVTDSAPGMANYVNGNKAQNNQEGVFPDDTDDAFDNPRIEYLSEYLHRLKGTSTGIVTTSDVFDATPAANAVHTSNRGAGTGIVDQYLDDSNLTGLTVLMGGGRKWFIPSNSTATAANSLNAGNGSTRSAGSDYVLSSDIVYGWGANTGTIDATRDVIAGFQSAGFTYASDKTTLVNAGAPAKLLGLFSYSNMNVAFDKINGRRGNATVVNDFGFPDQPMLDEMTESALNVLKQNTNGFVLTVEAASIDKQAHAMDSDRWMEEVIEFDRAIQKAKDFAAANPDTLVIVTADHECAGATLIGSSKGTFTGATASAENVAVYDAAKFPAYALEADGYPTTMDVPGKLLIGYGSNATRNESWLSSPQPAKDSQQPFNGQAPLSAYVTPTTRAGFSIPGQVGADAGGQATHTAADVQLSAYGRGATLFGGVIDNTDVFFKFGQAAIGGAK
jgi:alkaline phosphatase